MAAVSCPACNRVLNLPVGRYGVFRCPGCRGPVPFHAPAPPEAPEPNSAAYPRPAPGPEPVPDGPRPQHAAPRVARLVVWIICGLAVLGVLGSYTTALHQATTVFQQCAAAGDACAWMIGAYVFARCIDAVIRQLEPPQPRN